MIILKTILVLLIALHIFFLGYDKGYEVGYYIGASDVIHSKITIDDLTGRK